MHRISSLLSLAVASAALLACAAGKAQPPVRSSPARSEAQPSATVEIELYQKPNARTTASDNREEPVPKSLRALEPLWVKVSLKNRGKETLHDTELPYGGSNFKVLVRDASGAVCPLTTLGKAYYSDAGDEGQSSFQRIHLQPGEAIFLKIQVNALYDMTRGGHYTIVASRMLLTGQVVKSRPLYVELEEAPAEMQWEENPAIPRYGRTSGTGSN